MKAESLIDKVGARVFLECDLVLAIGIGLAMGSLISATLLLLVCKIPSISF